MKNLIFLFLGFFCFANSQIDSARMVQKLIKLEQTNKETKALIQKLDKVDSENSNLIRKIKVYIQKLTQKKEVTIVNISRPQAIKTQNINEPIVELQIPDGYDTIRGGFFYRLFHREKVYLRAYKLQENEKIYLD